jgi:hypothetical protein
MRGAKSAVPMVSDGGTFKVPVTINGQLTLKFVVDSGASDVSIPADVVGTLVRTETITDADFLGKQTYQMADGSTVPSMRFVIRSLKVGDKTLENVSGSIAPVAGSLLLGHEAPLRRTFVFCAITFGMSFGAPATELGVASYYGAAGLQRIAVCRWDRGSKSSISIMAAP